MPCLDRCFVPLQEEGEVLTCWYNSVVTFSMILKWAMISLFLDSTSSIQPFHTNVSMCFKYIHCKILERTEINGNTDAKLIEVLYLLQSTPCIQNFSLLYFPVLGLNTKRYSVSLRIQLECGKIRTRKTPNMDTSDAVVIRTIFRQAFDTSCWFFAEKAALF